VEAYLKNCPSLSFIGVNFYDCAEWLPDYSCAKPAQATVDELRAPLLRYRVGRNLPAITETNSGPDPVAQRLAYIAAGEFGVPIFAPWALNVSYPVSYAPYVLSDGSLANGAFALQDAYSSLSKALPAISYFAGTNKLKVFMAPLPGQRFSQTQDLDGFEAKVVGENNGQAIVIRPADHEFIVVGYRCGVSLKDPAFVWPSIKSIRVERGRWERNHWVREGEPEYGINESNNVLEVELDAPQAVHVSW
jgi:hypothetical protein